jgi:4-hydroxy-tetrahydrodipicolinate synthase
VARLAEVPNIIGLKDATADLSRPPRLRRLVGADFRLLTGDDATALGFFAQGGNGCISVTSNLAPGLCRSMFLAHRQGQSAQAQRLAEIAGALTAILFRETSPSPLKYALSLLGLILPAVRLPLVQPSGQLRSEIAAALMKLCEMHPDYMIGSGVRAINAA